MPDKKPSVEELIQILKEIIKTLLEKPSEITSINQVLQALEKNLADMVEAFFNIPHDQEKLQEFNFTIECFIKELCKKLFKSKLPNITADNIAEQLNPESSFSTSDTQIGLSIFSLEEQGFLIRHLYIMVLQASIDFCRTLSVIQNIDIFERIQPFIKFLKIISNTPIQNPDLKEKIIESIDQKIIELVSQLKSDEVINKKELVSTLEILLGTLVCLDAKKHSPKIFFDATKVCIDSYAAELELVNPTELSESHEVLTSKMEDLLLEAIPYYDACPDTEKSEVSQKILAITLTIRKSLDRFSHSLRNRSTFTDVTSRLASTLQKTEPQNSTHNNRSPIFRLNKYSETLDTFIKDFSLEKPTITYLLIKKLAENVTLLRTEFLTQINPSRALTVENATAAIFLLEQINKDIHQIVAAIASNRLTIAALKPHQIAMIRMLINILKDYDAIIEAIPSRLHNSEAKQLCKDTIKNYTENQGVLLTQREEKLRENILLKIRREFSEQSRNSEELAFLLTQLDYILDEESVYSAIQVKIHYLCRHLNNQDFDVFKKSSQELESLIWDINFHIKNPVLIFILISNMLNALANNAHQFLKTSENPPLDIPKVFESLKAFANTEHAFYELAKKIENNQGCDLTDRLIYALLTKYSTNQEQYSKFIDYYYELVKKDNILFMPKNLIYARILNIFASDIAKFFGLPNELFPITGNFFSKLHGYIAAQITQVQNNLKEKVASEKLQEYLARLIDQLSILSKIHDFFEAFSQRAGEIVGISNCKGFIQSYEISDIPNKTFALDSDAWSRIKANIKSLKETSIQADKKIKAIQKSVKEYEASLLAKIHVQHTETPDLKQKNEEEKARRKQEQDRKNEEDIRGRLKDSLGKLSDAIQTISPENKNLEAIITFNHEQDFEPLKSNFLEFIKPIFEKWISIILETAKTEDLKTVGLIYSHIETWITELRTLAKLVKRISPADNLEPSLQPLQDLSKGLLLTLTTLQRNAEDERKREERKQKEEARHRAEEERKRKERDDRRKAEEERKKQEEQRKADEERRKLEEQQKAEEECKRKEQEAQQKAEEERKRKEQEERQKTEEERKKQEEQRKADEERRKLEEQQKAEEECKRKEQEAQQKAEEERKRKEQEERQKRETKEQQPTRNGTHTNGLHPKLPVGAVFVGSDQPKVTTSTNIPSAGALDMQIRTALAYGNYGFALELAKTRQVSLPSNLLNYPTFEETINARQWALYHKDNAQAFLNQAFQALQLPIPKNPQQDPTFMAFLNCPNQDFLSGIFIELDPPFKYSVWMLIQNSNAAYQEYARLITALAQNVLDFCSRNHAAEFQFMV